jgi:hypothetical protein
MISLHMGAPEAEGRQFPGHKEGDLIKGAGNASAAGTLVERTSRRPILVKRPHPRPASDANVPLDFTDKSSRLASTIGRVWRYGSTGLMNRLVLPQRRWWRTSIYRGCI